MAFWLMKCEPAAYTIDDLARDGTTGWEGVRNYQARNYLRDQMKEGDGVLFYASNAEPSGVAGLAEIARAGYPDPFALRKGHRYFDPKSKAEEPTWYTVDLRFRARFAEVIPLARLHETPGLEAMMVLRKGSRLSIQPVTAEEFAIVARLGAASASASAATAAPAKAPAKKRAAPAKKAPAKKAPRAAAKGAGSTGPRAAARTSARPRPKGSR